MKIEGLISYQNECYVLCDGSRDCAQVLQPSEIFEVKLGGQWCWVRLESGGYKGRYYVTAAGERGRLALGMQARIGEQLQVEQTGTAPLDLARLTWVGKVVESRVPLAGGLVRGVVHEITQRGQVVLVYTSRLNRVPVIVSFPVERIEEVLSLASSPVAI